MTDFDEKLENAIVVVLKRNMQELQSEAFMFMYENNGTHVVNLGAGGNVVITEQQSNAITERVAELDGDLRVTQLPVSGVSDYKLGDDMLDVTYISAPPAKQTALRNAITDIARPEHEKPEYTAPKLAP